MQNKRVRGIATYYPSGSLKKVVVCTANKQCVEFSATNNGAENFVEMPRTPNKQADAALVRQSKEIAKDTSMVTDKIQAPLKTEAQKRGWIRFLSKINVENVTFWIGIIIHMWQLTLLMYNAGVFSFSLFSTIGQFLSSNLPERAQWATTWFGRLTFLWKFGVNNPNAGKTTSEALTNFAGDLIKGDPAAVAGVSTALQTGEAMGTAAANVTAGAISKTAAAVIGGAMNTSDVGQAKFADMVHNFFDKSRAVSKVYKDLSAELLYADPTHVHTIVNRLQKDNELASVLYHTSQNKKLRKEDVAALSLAALVKRANYQSRLTRLTPLSDKAQYLHKTILTLDALIRTLDMRVQKKQVV